ncbi:MAG: PAS domain S-box protein, partial [Calditrichia bacterium]
DTELWFRTLHPEDVPVLMESTQQIFASKKPGIRKYRLRHKHTAEYRWMEDKVVPQIDDAGKVVGYYGVARDITERKRAEEALKQAEEKYRSIFENAAEGIFQSTIDGRYQIANPMLARILGYASPEELMESVTDFDKQFYVKPGRREEFMRLLKEQDAISGFESQIFRKDGSVIWVSENARAIRGSRGNLTGFEGTTTDVTKRKKAEEALKESEEYFRALIENASDVVSILNENGIVTYESPSHKSVLGYDTGYLIGKNVFEFVHPDDQERISQQFAGLLQKSGRIEQVNFRFLHQDGTWRHIEGTGKNLLNSPKVKGIVVNYRDITERKQAEEEQKKQISVIENSQEFIGIATLDGKVIYLNPFGQNLVGLSGMDEVKSTTLFDYVSEDMRRKLEQKIMPKVFQQGYDTGEGSLQHFKTKQDIITDYSVFQIHSLAKDEPNYIGIIMRDIRDRKKLEEEKEELRGQLYQQQKLESIGTLASGVAHEINNPLMGIINYAQLINDRIMDDKLKDFSQEIINEGERVAKIVSNLLSFARQEKEQHSPANIKDIIDAAFMLISAVFRKEQIKIIKEIAENLPEIKCRSQQIEQVIINLLTNAMYTLNKRYPDYHENKQIKIVVKPFQRKKMKWIRITVEDYGEGITEENMKRIFDPFFTTKPRDEGTGLGLSVSYGIIKEHKGKLTVESVAGEYTRFNVELPVNNGWSLRNQE